MIGSLPEKLSVGGVEYPIRTDYRNVLQVFEVFSDPELEDLERWIVTIFLLFEDFSCADDVFQAAEEGFNIGEVQEQILWFISAGAPENKRLELPTYNWQQDEQLIFSAVNKVAGTETRSLGYLHWWTFLGYFQEVGEGNFSFIVGIRHKLNKGKKLEKYEKEFIAENPKMVKLRKPMTETEKEEEKELRLLLDEVLG